MTKRACDSNSTWIRRPSSVIFFALLLSWIETAVIASECLLSTWSLTADCFCLLSLKMVALLVNVLSQHFMWTWIQEFAIGLAKLNKQVYSIFRDNIQAESCFIQETCETRHLIDLWSEDELPRCEGCDDRSCYWCTGWSRKVIALDSSPEWSDAYSDNSWIFYMHFFSGRSIQQILLSVRQVLKSRIVHILHALLSKEK